MIIFLLLVIIAIMLLGASRFIGIVGMVGGGCAALLAVFFGIVAIARATGADSGDILMYLCLAILPVAIGAGLMGVGSKSTGSLPPKNSPAPDQSSRHRGLWDRDGDHDGNY